MKFTFNNKFFILTGCYILSLVGNMPPYHLFYEDLITPINAIELLEKTEAPSVAQVRHLQIYNPFQNLPEWGGSTQGKYDFRILVPVLSYYTHTPLITWVYIQHLLGVVFFIIWYNYWNRVLNNQTYALLLTCTLLFTAFFKTFNLDLYPRFDAYGYFLLFLVWNFRTKPYMALLLFISFWIDERTVLAGFMISCLMYIENTKGKKVIFPLMMFSLLAYGGTRYLLYLHYGMETSSKSVATAPVVLNNWPHLLYGIQSSLKCLTLVAVVYLFHLFRNREYKTFILYGGCMFMAIMGTVIIVDMTRSNGYYFLLVVFALERLMLSTQYNENLKIVALWCIFLICFFIPTFYLYGEKFILYSPWYSYF